MLRSRKNNRSPYNNACLVEAASAHEKTFEPRFYLDIHSNLEWRNSLSLAVFLARLTTFLVKAKSFFSFYLSFPRCNVRVILSHLHNGDVLKLKAVRE